MKNNEHKNGRWGMRRGKLSEVKDAKKEIKL
jgi:hypothetical protein